MTREGLALDMQVTLTASRANAMKTPMYINMKTRIAMFLYDKSEVSNVVGQQKFAVKDVVGRALLSSSDYNDYSILANHLNMMRPNHIMIKLMMKYRR